METRKSSGISLELAAAAVTLAKLASTTAPARFLTLPVFILFWTRVNQFHVTDGVGRLLDLARYALVAFAAKTDRPIDRGSAADFRFPFLADLGQIVGPDVGGAAAVGTVDHNNVSGRQFDTGVGFHQFRIVPFGDLTEEDPRQRIRREVEIRAHAGDVIDRHIGAHYRREVQDSETVLVAGTL